MDTNQSIMSLKEFIESLAMLTERQRGLYAVVCNTEEHGHATVEQWETFCKLVMDLVNTPDED